MVELRTENLVGVTLMLLLLLLVQSVTTTTTTTSKEICEDRILNCNDYDISTCRTYPSWAERNCAQTCGACQDVCPEGWSYYSKGKTCLKVFGLDSPDNHSSWWEARKSCQSFGGDLVVIRDYKLTFYLIDLVMNYFEYWIGLINVGNNGFLFMYTDSSRLEANSYQPWIPDNPDDYQGREKCVCMYPRGPFTGRWNDNGCNLKLPYICQKEPRK